MVQRHMCRQNTHPHKKDENRRKTESNLRVEKTAQSGKSTVKTASPELILKTTTTNRHGDVNPALAR